MPDDVITGLEADEPEGVDVGDAGAAAEDQGAASQQPAEQPQQTAPVQQQQAQQQPAQQHEPYIPPWLRTQQPPTAERFAQPPQQPPPGPANVMDMARAAAEREAARTGERPEDVLARMLADPDSVISERLQPLQQELQHMRMMMEMQMRAQQQAREQEAREIVEHLYRDSFSKDPHVAGSEAVRENLDRVVMGYFRDALARAAYGDYTGIAYLRSEEFRNAALALAKAAAGVLTFGAEQQPAPHPAAQPAPAQPAQPTPGTAREETSVELPQEIDEETLHVLERYGIPRDRVVESIKKWGW